ncbi:phosphatidate cytidylyltransferase [Paracraurococcus ruber]|uniref:Phosphatidate cytidylyltransferase n=1 Tax=Paracraurococcus ruber TaxID=77675 RepID=A0ABS1CZ79_9PROT|nr:phosphatidate cytidylyltransferase [Paracraurococcus ruber]TDG33068.1 phosphatidate cytidylyltransferase [Paracraurococcus ruber]
MAGGSGATVPGPADPAPPLPARWPDLRKRAISAALLLPAAVLCIWLGAEAWAALMAAAVALLAWEWTRLCGFSTRRLPGMAVPLVTLAAGTLAVEQRWSWALGLVVAGFLGLWAAGRPPGLRRAQPGFWLAFGLLYIGLAGIALIHLRGDQAAGRANVLFLFLVVWASDIGAYLAGRRFGGPKLAPAISPNKTWSGALGGLGAAMLVGLLAAAVIEGGTMPPGRVLLVAAVIGVLAQAGDLFESWLKRRFQVKDSSALIPGHGGLLDRLDGVLPAAPAAALLGVLLGPGAALWH